MSKKKDKKFKADETTKGLLGEALPSSLTVEGEEIKLTTKKSYLKTAEKLVRRVDHIVTDLHEVSNEASTLTNTLIETEVHEKDRARFTEMANVLVSARDILYHLTERMSRKYVGKEIDSIHSINRKSLKK